ncbi:MAG TPA: APC family permease [Burkholderiaceae bacterium]|nr:APC family permease [Burkholderiaceae bacterium]
MAPARIRTLLFGKPLDPTRADTRQSLALAAFLAWVGLGADGLSSSAYGPEEAFKALGPHTEFGLYLAVATAITVFVIALAYNQIIELFPTGGGGYRVATTLLGPHAGLVAGAALIVDYMLTITISAAAGVDAVFSLMPGDWQGYKLVCACAVIILLLYLNLRGVRESIMVLLPIFAGFAVTHAFLIVYGIAAHAEGIGGLIPATIADTTELASETSWMFVVALFMKAYSLGGGTYTGIEAVSNNVQHLAEPREKTGKATMLLMATSLAFTAGGIILLYLLWDARVTEGSTLNAVVFKEVLANAGFDGHNLTVALTTVLAFEAGLLFIAANTGFLGGPAVLANMAVDSWVPHKFRYLSQRLVTQNGLVLMGAGALGILFITNGQVHLLVVLYSINVFLTFALSLLGLVKYWIKHKEQPRRLWRLSLSLAGFLITIGILTGTIIEKFFDGGWVTLFITGLVIGLCMLVRTHYRDTKNKIGQVDAVFANQPFGSETQFPEPDPQAPTAAFIVGSSRGGGLHALLWVQRMFPNHFRNFLFINARTVDSHAYGGHEALELLQTDARVSLKYFENFCHSYGLASKSYLGFGTDVVEEVHTLCERVQREFPNVIFFTSKLIFQHENWFTRLLHNQAAVAIQRRLHLNGMQMVILPMKV